MKTHELKTWPTHFDAIWKGYKKFDFRYNDRDFKMGELLHLREWQPDHNWAMTRGGEYTGRSALARIDYILKDTEPEVLQPEFVPEGWCIMSLAVMHMEKNGEYIVG